MPGAPRLVSSCFSSGAANMVANLCYGVLLGGPGGLLLARMAAVVVQSLELMAANMPLMDHLFSYIKESKGRDLSTAERLGVPQTTDSERMFNSYIAIWTEEFCSLCIALSSAAGVPVGLIMYQRVIERDGENATGKALVQGGPLVLMVVTATGCVVGSLLENFLLLHPVSMIGFFFSILLFLSCFNCGFDVAVAYGLCFMSPLNTPVVLLLMWGLTDMVRTKLLLMAAFLPKVLVMVSSEDLGFQTVIAPVPLMLVITDMFNFATRPIVTLQSPTNTSSAAAEAIFVGVVASQFTMVAVGMSLFISWQSGGAGKICVGAVASGVAVVDFMERVLPVLGPGPTIGALMGVAGAVGVTLAAAGAATDSFGQHVAWSRYAGRLGVTAGAAVVTFLYLRTQSGLSEMFVALCAATIPAGVHLKPLLLFVHKNITGWKFRSILCIVITPILSTWLYFTCATLCVTLLIGLIVTVIVYTPVVGLMLGCWFTWKLVRRTVAAEQHSNNPQRWLMEVV